MKDYCVTKRAIIPNGQSLSNIIDLENYTRLAIYMPTAWTAATITLLAAPTMEGPFQAVFDEANTEVSITVAASRVHGLGTAQTDRLGALRFIQLRSGTSGTPVAQAAERTIMLIAKR